MDPLNQLVNSLVNQFIHRRAGQSGRTRREQSNQGHGSLAQIQKYFRIALTLDHLSIFIDYFYKKYPKFNAATYHAAIVIAFWCMLRSNEYTYINKNKLPIKNQHISLLKSNNLQYYRLTLINPKTAKYSSQTSVI